MTTPSDEHNAPSIPSFATFRGNPNGTPPAESRPVVCIQGLGFVGAAMAVATAHARSEHGQPCFNVIGVDLDSEDGRAKVQAINQGRLPLTSNDKKLETAAKAAYDRGNLIATTDPQAYAQASVCVVDVHLDVNFQAHPPTLVMDGFLNAIETLGRHISAECLTIVETTVPPGTCEKRVFPILKRCFRDRGLTKEPLLAHAYERVMPGDSYFDSLVNIWRVYAGHSDQAAERCQAFLSQVVNVADYPLTRLHSTTASETAKVLENSYRAVNIAFIEEWGHFAEEVGIDLFQVIKAIRMRPTHSNIRQPGFGVGGYCLTKDPLFPLLASREILGRPDLTFPFCSKAVETNDRMPLHTLRRLSELLGGTLGDKRVALMGVSYRPDVGDTRYSPSESFVRAAVEQGAKVLCHDPLVRYWPELNIPVLRDWPEAAALDAVVFAVGHREYRETDLGAWMKGHRPVILDANDVLTAGQRVAARDSGCPVFSIGRGPLN